MGLYIKKYFTGISFSSITFSRSTLETYNLKENLEKSNYSIIGKISLEINKAYYDNYKRSYKKLQTLFAELWV